MSARRPRGVTRQEPTTAGAETAGVEIARVGDAAEIGAAEANAARRDVGRAARGRVTSERQILPPFTIREFAARVERGIRGMMWLDAARIPLN